MPQLFGIHGSTRQRVWATLATKSITTWFASKLVPLPSGSSLEVARHGLVVRHWPLHSLICLKNHHHLLNGIVALVLMTIFLFSVNKMWDRNGRDDKIMVRTYWCNHSAGGGEKSVKREWDLWIGKRGLMKLWEDVHKGKVIQYLPCPFLIGKMRCRYWLAYFPVLCIFRGDHP